MINVCLDGNSPVKPSRAGKALGVEPIVEAGHDADLAQFPLASRAPEPTGSHDKYGPDPESHSA